MLDSALRSQETGKSPFETVAAVQALVNSGSLSGLSAVQHSTVPRLALIQSVGAEIV